MLVADRLIRPMRGRSQSVHLAAGGWHYVVKPPSIGLRALISEWLGARLLSMLGILAADVQPIVVPARLAAECWPRHEYREDVVAAASSYPVDPDTNAVYDLMPPSIPLANSDHLVGTLVVDLWTGRSTPRQHVFFRQGPWWAWAIDHKDSFSPVNGSPGGNPANPVLRRAYLDLLEESAVKYWTRRIGAIPTHTLENLLDSIPESWRDGTACHELRLHLATLPGRRIKLQNQLRAILRCGSWTPQRDAVPCSQTGNA